MEANEEANVLLMEAFEKKDLEAFKTALANGAKYPGILCKALHSHGYVEFVKAYVSSEEELENHFKMLPNLINWASASHDPEILSYILNTFGHRRRISIIPDQNFTPLNNLTKYITLVNFDDTFRCIKLLIAHKIDPNEMDDQGITPILNIIHNKKLNEEKKKEIIQNLVTLNNPRVNIDIFTPGQDTARTILKNTFSIERYNPAKVDINFKCIYELVEKKQEETLIKSIEKFESYLSELKVPFTLKKGIYQNLLEIIIKYNLLQALRFLRRSKNITNLDYTYAIDFACDRGYSEPLDILLNNPYFILNDLNGEKYLKTLLFSWRSKHEISDYRECLNILLSFPLIQFRNKFWKRISYYMNKDNEEAFIILLDKRVCKIDTHFVRYIDPKILEKYFDSCIIANNKGITEEYFKVCIDYSSLPRCYNYDEESKKSEEIEETEENISLHCIEGKRIFIIKKLADCKDKKYLLGHPFITSFLFLKWRTLSFYFYLNFFCSLVFCLFLVSYIIADFNNTLNGAVWITLFVFIIVGLSYIIVREIIQAITLKKEMFNTFIVGFPNVIETLLIIFTILTLCHSGYKDEPGRSFAVITILLACVEVYLLIGSLPVLNLSTHMLMLNAVCWSFIKSFCQYFMFFIAFGLCFHMVFSKTENSTTSEDSSRDSEYFNSPWRSIFKSFIMVTGEFDSGNIYFNSPISYGILLIFVAFMSIVLLNLLTGLAVSDIQMIREQAEFNSFISCTYHIARLEKSIIFFKNNCLFRSICGQFINSLNDDIDVKDSIIILPNKDNETHTHESECISSIYTLPKPLFSCFCCPSFNRKPTRMDPKIVEAAIDVMKKNQKTEIKENIIAEKHLRLNDIINKVEKQLQNIEGKVQSQLTNIQTKIDAVETQLKYIQKNKGG